MGALANAAPVPHILLPDLTTTQSTPERNLDRYQSIGPKQCFYPFLLCPKPLVASLWVLLVQDLGCPIYKSKSKPLFVFLIWSGCGYTFITLLIAWTYAGAYPRVITVMHDKAFRYESCSWQTIANSKL